VYEKKVVRRPIKCDCFFVLNLYSSFPFPLYTFSYFYSQFVSNFYSTFANQVKVNMKTDFRFT
jgi:hypothetical protein